MNASAVESTLSEMPPPAPRGVTVRGRRRSWGEPGVRTWWLSALVLALIAGGLTVARLMGSASDRQLAREGRRVAATIRNTGDTWIPGQKVTPDADATFEFEFDLDGKKQIVKGKLKQQRQPLGAGDVVTLYVDPENPRRFTDRAEISLREDLFVLVLIVPVVALLALVAALLRGRVLRTWRDGEAMAAVVVETRQAASAPMSRLVRYTLRDVKDNRVFSTFVPTKAGVLQPGDVFWVVGGKGRAVVAGLYA